MIQKIIDAVWNDGSFTASFQDVKNLLDNKNIVKNDILDAEGIIAKIDGDNVIFSRENNMPIPVEIAHKYDMPNFTNNVKALLSKASNIMLTGPMGTGKTEFVYEIAKQMDFAKVYHINGSENLTPMDFHGSTVVDVDLATGQNYTRFDKGSLYRAFIEGTKLDSNGNQELDDEGNPIVIGKPAIFFLDEFAAMLPEVLLGVFNRALEIPRNNGVRSIEIPADNGRIVKSHPNFCIILSGNTVGTGNIGDFQVSYTAQSNRMDESTLNRVIAGFKFGYNRDAEYTLAINHFNDDFIVDGILRMRDDLRNMFRNGRIERLFSTRTLVSICKVACMYKQANITNWITDAIRDSVFNSLPENDKSAWNEEIRIIFGVDLMAEESKQNKKYDYF